MDYGIYYKGIVCKCGAWFEKCPNCKYRAYCPGQGLCTNCKYRRPEGKLVRQFDASEKGLSRNQLNRPTPTALIFKPLPIGNVEIFINKTGRGRKRK